MKKWNSAEITERYESIITQEIPSGTGARQKALEYERNRANELRIKGELDPTKHVRP